eukprot:1850514-Prorocentrum_lima.AAC.1
MLHLCGINQHFAKDCTRPKGDPNKPSPSNMFQNRGKQSGKGNPNPDAGATPQTPSKPAQKGSSLYRKRERWPLHG